MSGPWEDYKSSASKPASGGPWEDYAAPPPAAPQTQPSTAPSYGIVDAAVDVGRGALKGLGDLAMRAIPEPIKRVSGISIAAEDPAVQAKITPQNTAEKFGFGAEKIGEFFIPGGATRGVAKTITGRALLEATSAGGVAGMQTGSDPAEMAKAAATAGVFTAAAPLVSKAIKPAAAALKAGAVKQMGTVLNATKTGDKYLSAKIAPELVERGVTAGSLKGLNARATGEVQRLGEAIGGAWDNLPAGSSVELEPIFNRLNQEIGEHTISAGGRVLPKGPEAKAAIDKLNGLQEVLLDVSEKNPTTGALEIPVERVRSLRQYWDGIASRAGRFEGKTLAEASSAEAHANASNAIREELGKQFPDIASLNKEFTFWKNVERVTGDTILRREGQAKPLSRKLFQLGGTVAGGAQGGVQGAIVGATVASKLQEVLGSTAWGTVGAMAKDRLANALAKGSRPEIEFAAEKIFRSLGYSLASPANAERSTK